MKKIVVAMSVVLLASTLARAGTDTIAVEPNQAVIQVNGVVCSFCAFGVEKNLSKMDFLDKTQFGKDGVMIDIHTHRVVLALQRDKKLDLPLIYHAIKKGGYDPVMVYMNVHGQVSKEEERYLLTCPDSGQYFELIGSDAEQWVGKGLVDIRGQLDAGLIPDLKAGQPVPLFLSAESMK